MEKSSLVEPSVLGRQKRSHLHREQLPDGLVVSLTGRGKEARGTDVFSLLYTIFQSENQVEEVLPLYRRENEYLVGCYEVLHYYAEKIFTQKEASKHDTIFTKDYLSRKSTTNTTPFDALLLLATATSKHRVCACSYRIQYYRSMTIYLVN